MFHAYTVVNNGDDNIACAGCGLPGGRDIAAAQLSEQCPLIGIEWIGERECRDAVTMDGSGIGPDRQDQLPPGVWHGVQHIRITGDPGGNLPCMGERGMGRQLIDIGAVSHGAAISQWGAGQPADAHVQVVCQDGVGPQADEDLVRGIRVMGQEIPYRERAGQCLRGRQETRGDEGGGQEGQVMYKFLFFLFMETLHKWAAPASAGSLFIGLFYLRSPAVTASVLPKRNRELSL